MSKTSPVITKDEEPVLVDVAKQSKVIMVSAVVFSRTEQQKANAESEIGLIINEGQLIIDSDGKPVEQIWDYHIRFPAGSLAVETNSQLNTMI